MLSVDRLRADTPGCLDKVFLDSAGSSLPPAPVLDAVVGHLRREAEIGGYRAAAEADVDGVRRSLGTLLGCPASSVALSDSATRAWSSFFYAVPLRPGDRILLSGVEYHSNAIAALQRARATGATVEVVPSDPAGCVDVEALAAMLDERVRIVSLVHVPTNGGLVNPVRPVVDLAHAYGALVLLDACQSVGQLPVDVTALDVDALSGTGRKWLRAPRGTGFLYVRPELIPTLEPTVLDSHSAAWTGPASYEVAADATRFELWECSVADRLGLGAAVDYLLELGVPAVAAEVGARAGLLRAGLAELTGVTVRDLGREQCGIVSFTVDGVEPAAVRDALFASSVYVTVSLARSTLLDMSARALPAVVRASPHYFVSDDDITRAVTAVAAL